MPELSEVEHVKRGTGPFIKSAKIEKVTFAKNVINGKNNSRETIVKGMELDTFKKLTEGYVIKKVGKKSKYIIFYIADHDDGRILVSHSGMAGGFFVINNLDEISAPNYRKHWQVIFDLDNKQKLVYSDIRRLGEIRNIVNFNSCPSLLGIAPEPFEEVAFGHYLECLTMKKYKNKPVEQTIPDHRVIAGAGNIHACEALFRAGITPDEITNSFTK